jgi:GNAT superfamily N-acetyltransferase
MDYKIRRLEPRDVSSLAALHVEAFHETHGGFATAGELQLREGQWRSLFDQDPSGWFCFVAEGSQGELLGFAKGVPYEEDDLGTYKGKLHKIYLLRRYHRHGIGRTLVGYVAREFIARGIHSMLLFGEARNPSNGFYEALGAERLYSAEGEFHGAYGWRDISALAAEP